LSSVLSLSAFVSTHTTAAALAAVPSSTSSSTMLRSVTTITSQNSNSSIADARNQRFVYGENDALFGYIEDQQGNTPFGKVLDAGTGVHSLRWIATLGGLGRTRNNRTTSHKGLTDFVAVTADETMRHTVQHEMDALGLNHLGKIVIGNWFPAASNNNNSNNNNNNNHNNSHDAGTTDEAALRSIDYDETGQRQLYDTIIADYLIGAMDGFSPYKQDMMLDLLAQRLQPGGRLYIVGLEPIPDSYGTPPNSPQAIISDVRRIRDACILLAGDRCYREYPVEWIERQLHSKQAQPSPPAHTNDSTNNNHSSNTPRLHWLASKQFPILYSHRTIVKQIEVARKKLPQIPSKALARELSNTLRELELRSYAATEQISKTTRIQCGFDYVVSAERSMPDGNSSISNNKGGGDDSSLDHIHTNEEL